MKPWSGNDKIFQYRDVNHKVTENLHVLKLC